MRKLFIIPLLLGVLQAEDFETFLQDALAKSPYLKANALIIEQAKVKATLIQRYKNPSLSLEVSNFSLTSGGEKSGFATAIVQPIRLWGISQDREALADAQKLQAEQFVKLSRAKFILKLSLLYTRYKNALKSESLAEAELLISQKILAISQARFESGTIAKVKFIQSKLDMKRVKNIRNELEINTQTTYSTLMALSGLEEEIFLDTRYEFKRSQTHSIQNSAQISYTKSKQKRALTQAQLSANKIEWFKLYASYEKEPDQRISRVGVDIPLAIFNTQKEEKTIANIKAKSSEFLVQNQTHRMKINLTKIDKSIEMLETLKLSSEELLEAQKELLEMYEDGYKIANINLIELQLIKNQMIQTQAKLINIQTRKEQNIIQHNFLTGEYNE